VEGEGGNFYSALANSVAPSQTALLFAAFAGFGNAKETTQTLIEAGAKTDALSGFGANIFTEAAMVREGKGGVGETKETNSVLLPEPRR